MVYVTGISIEPQNLLLNPETLAGRSHASVQVMVVKACSSYCNCLCMS